MMYLHRPPPPSPSVGLGSLVSQGRPYIGSKQGFRVLKRGLDLVLQGSGLRV